MTGFLRRLAARAIGVDKPVRPRTGLLFPPVRNEIWPGSDDAHVAQDFHQDRDVEGGRPSRTRDVTQAGHEAAIVTAQTDRAIERRQSTVRPLEVTHDASMGAARHREPAQLKATRTSDSRGDVPVSRDEAVPAAEPPSAAHQTRSTGSLNAERRAEPLSIANDRRGRRSDQDDTRQTDRFSSPMRSREAESFESQARQTPRADVSSINTTAATTRSDEPRVRISIGRVEVRVAAATQPAERPRKAAAPLSLDEYLKELAGRRP